MNQISFVVMRLIDTSRLFETLDYFIQIQKSIFYDDVKGFSATSNIIQRQSQYYLLQQKIYYLFPWEVPLDQWLLLQTFSLLLVLKCTQLDFFQVGETYNINIEIPLIRQNSVTNLTKTLNLFKQFLTNQQRLTKYQYNIFRYVR